MKTTVDEKLLRIRRERERLKNLYSESELKEVFNEVDAALESVERQHLTCGHYNTEKDAEVFFDAHINQKYFTVEREIKGRRLFDDKPVAENKNGNRQWCRIDRMLYPTASAIEAGWKNGPIGVEIKKNKKAC